MRELQLVLFRDRLCALPKLYRTGTAALWRIFSLGSRTPNKSSMASALHLPTSKSIENQIVLGVQHYKILNSIWNFKREIKNFKIKSEVYSKYCLMLPLSGCSNLAGRFPLTEFIKINILSFSLLCYLILTTILTSTALTLSMTLTMVLTRIVNHFPDTDLDTGNGHDPDADHDPDTVHYRAVTLTMTHTLTWPRHWPWPWHCQLTETRAMTFKLPSDPLTIILTLTMTLPQTMTLIQSQNPDSDQNP